MPDLSNINTIHEILSRHGFKFTKSLGQNFITNPNLCPEIAEASGLGDGICALEIGPGIGVLTKELAERAEKVLAIEIDSSLIPVLRETLADYDNVTVLNEDVMKIDVRKAVREAFGDMPFVVCANLPYYITSPVLMKLLEEEIGAQSITVMVQKEAADRITAAPGSRDCGAITSAIHYYSIPEKLFDVTKDNFVPAPKVDSSVISLLIREKPPVDIDDRKYFFKVIRAAFCQRRKTLPNSLSAGLGYDKGAVTETLVSLGYKPTARAEEMTLSDFAAISTALLKVEQENI